MAIRKIRLLGDPVLRAEAAPVDAVDESVRELVKDLLDTLAKADGVGLAAPQIGVSRRVIVVAPPVPEGTPPAAPRAYVNPRIAEASGPILPAEEGCLSIPGIYEIVKRPSRVRVLSLDGEGAAVDEVLEGIAARILQHEIDHLNGVLFIDKIGPMRRALLRKKLHAFLD